MAFQIPEPYSAPLNFYYTREDARKSFQRLVELYEQLGVKPEELDWKAIRRTSGDSMATQIHLLERKIAKESK